MAGSGFALPARRSGRALEGIGHNVAGQPRYRDAGIALLVAAALGAILGADIAVRAWDGLPESKETRAWSVAALIGAVVMFGLGLRSLRLAKKGG